MGETLQTFRERLFLTPLQARDDLADPIHLLLAHLLSYQVAGSCNALLAPGLDDITEKDLLLPQQDAQLFDSDASFGILDESAAVERDRRAGIERRRGTARGTSSLPVMT